LVGVVVVALPVIVVRETLPVVVVAALPVIVVVELLVCANDCFSVIGLKATRAARAIMATATEAAIIFFIEKVKQKSF
jgi:hypothetical protein